MSKQRTPMLFLPPKPPVALPDEGVFVIGRSRNCDLTLGSIDASRRHSEILCSTQGYRLRDLGSTNGTYLNGQRIEEQTLRPGDRIEIGGDLITFCEFEAGLEIPAPVGDTEAHTALVARPGAAADGLHGSLAEIPPFAVLQMLEMGRKSGVIEFESAAGGGKLWLVDGKPVHAATEHQRGFDAAIALVQLSAGRFNFEANRAAPEQTIRASITELLLEASRLLDEAR